MYFNPRSHERSDCAGLIFDSLLIISIHAPTRGATQACLSGITMYVISIHAPTRGATLHYSIDIKTIIFQSTLPREERRKCSTINAISTYFNPRSHERSDSVAQGTLHPHKDFNPRSHERSDCQLLLQAQIQFLFQSTLPREERQGLANRQGNTGGDFNPRSHERSDG